MRDKIGPWTPVIFCAGLSLLTVVGNLVTQFITGTSDGVTVVFYCFLPMCFYMVGAFLSQLQKENHELRARIDKLTSTPNAEED